MGNLQKRAVQRAPLFFRARREMERNRGSRQGIEAGMTAGRSTTAVKRDLLARGMATTRDLFVEERLWEVYHITVSRCYKVALCGDSINHCHNNNITCSWTKVTSKINGQSRLLTLSALICGTCTLYLLFVLVSIRSSLKSTSTRYLSNNGEGKHSSSKKSQVVQSPKFAPSKGKLDC